MKRRDFLKNSGLIIASFSLSGLAESSAAARAAAPYLTTEPDPRELDSFIAIAQDGAVHTFSSKDRQRPGHGNSFSNEMMSR